MDIIMAVTPGHGEVVPAKELSTDEILKDYEDNIRDTIIGYVEIYNEYNPDDVMDAEEMVEDWLPMEMEIIRNTEGPNQMWYQLQKIKEKYENEVEKIMSNEL